MQNLTNVLDEFVLKLKSVQELSGIRFVHAGKGEAAERPVQGFLVACGAGKEEYTGAENYKGTLVFTLYAPQGEGKRALTLLSQRLARGLKEADTTACLEKITVADSTFDSNLTVYKQVVSAVYAHSPQNEPQQEKNYESVYIGAQEYSGVSSFEVVAECSDYERRELLAGAVEVYAAPKQKYTISFSVYTADLLLDLLANKSISLYRVSTDMTYDDCRLVKMEEKAEGRQVLTFVCRRAHKGAEVSA